MDDINVPQSNPMGKCIAALLCGLIGVVLVFIDGMAAIGFAIGAIGLVLGGFAINIASKSTGNERMMLMAFAGLGIMLSVLAFMLGISKLVS